MPFKRRFKLKRRRVRRRVRRSLRGPRGLLSKYSNVHHFVRKCRIGTITIDNASGGYAAFSYQVQLNNLPNSSEFTALYDQYRMNYVKYHFVIRGFSTGTLEYINSQVGAPMAIAAVDRDDATAPSADQAGMDSIREYRYSKATAFTPERRTFTMAWKPSVLSEMYRSPTSAYSPVYNKWIDCQTPGVPHYGLKGVFQIPLGIANISADFDIDVFATYYFSMKGVR